MIDERLSVGDHAPAFALPDPRGSVHQLDPGAHAASVVVFTANGCPYALAWRDRIQAVARDYAQHDVQVLQVISNDGTHHPEDSIDGMRSRIHEGELEGLFLHDARQSVAVAYGATATPEVFVIDRAGVVRYTGAPDDDHDDETRRATWLRAALDDVLAGRPVAFPVSSPLGCSIKWRVELLWWAGCPTHTDAAAVLRSTLDDMGRAEVVVLEREVRRQAEAKQLGFAGSPTFAVGARDLFPTDAPASLTCRVYAQPDGRLSPLPDHDDLRERLRSALARPWDLPSWTDRRKQHPSQPA